MSHQWMQIGAKNDYISIFDDNGTIGMKSEYVQMESTIGMKNANVHHGNIPNPSHFGNHANPIDDNDYNNHDDDHHNHANPANPRTELEEE